MLLESLLEPSPVQRRRRRWATLLSFLVQCFAISGLVILPLLYTEALPHLRDVISLPAPPPPPGRAAARQLVRHSRPATASDIAPQGFHMPGQIPHGIHNLPEQQLASAPPVDKFIAEAISGGSPNGVLDSILATRAAPTPPPPSRRAPVRVSEGVTEGLRIREVAPAYPRIAQAAGIQGDVRLCAIISRNGEIENLQVLSGHPLLVTAALDAVRQWRYRPFYLNGDPVEVSTQITVRFVLQH